ncbi:Zinc carboxypeptidase [Catalinimonas alkaloidigena]|uniref:Zinc carboxypeptidase n=1 Tax=Catalinimonas alkaloidigena TaxID=1075417 RepID=A0A1G9P9M1_9BACT|nr:M14 family metallopeptidase [Catalinimonas alkaloidigena]SDL95450.1 Zinc carboxypeptidase [Catalinimonas alkaloidigena]
MKRFYALLFGLLLFQSGYAQQSPQEFLGYPLGSHFTPHHRVVAYVQHVAAQSPYVQVQQFGETYEGRPLLALTVTSPANQQRLEALRTAHLQRAGLLEGTPGLADNVAIVWLSYGVHGNESVSTEASMLTLYELISNPEKRQWLDNTVVIMDPCLNPDGRERYVHWYQQTVGYPNNPHPDAWEHQEPWPRGRTNHYYFDLNRDWAWQIQQESQARHKLYQQWLPHVHADFHEMGPSASYFFAPSAEPFHKDVTPWQREFQQTIGRNHAKYFDQAGWLYFTREVYDLFYPSYGDTWPTLNGAIGMTYEQGGSGRAGLALIVADGDTLTLDERLAHHYTTGLSTVEIASQHADRLTSEFDRFFSESTRNPRGTFRTYAISAGQHPDAVKHLTTYLDQLGIQYGYAGRAASSRRGYNYMTGQTGAVQVQPGDVLVSAYQPRSTMVKTLFEPTTVLSDSLTYDITAWALPYSFGVQAYALPERLTPQAAQPTPTTSPAAPSVEGTPYAYLIPWTGLNDARLLAHLLNQGVRFRYASEPFALGGTTYGAGTLIALRDDNGAVRAQFDTLVPNAGTRLDVAVVPITTGWVDQGRDLGSSFVQRLEAPRVGVLAGPEVSSLNFGETWHFFERQLGYPVTVLPTESFGRVDLADYDVLILPEGDYGDLLSEARRTELTDWLRAGGRLIATGRATQAFVGQKGYGLAWQPSDSATRSEAKQLNSRLKTYGQRDRKEASAAIPGAIFKTSLDTTHPLAFGYAPEYYTLKQDTLAYTYLTKGWNVGVIKSEALVSGFVGRKAQPKTSQALVFGVQPMGRGSVVYLVDNPLFRGFWHSGKLLYCNAVFLRE